MRQFKRAGSVVGYGFAAWLSAALIVYAASALPGYARDAVRYAAIAGTFWTVFRLYFAGRPDPFHPLAAGALAVAAVAGIDLALLAPYYLHPMDLYKSFWDWQLPALVALGAIWSAGWGRPKPALTKPLRARH